MFSLKDMICVKFIILFQQNNDSEMKSLALVCSLLFLGGEVYGKNGWENQRRDLVDEEADIAIREERRLKTSIIVLDIRV